MARQVQVHLVDDLDGSPADETLVFGLDGVGYAIDLSTANAAALRARLSPYTKAARRLPRTGGVTTGATGRPAAGAHAVRNQAIREWARRHDIELRDRGRIAHSIIVRYEARTDR